MIKNIIFDFGGVILKHKATAMEEIISEIFSIPFDEASEIWKRERGDLLIGQLTSAVFLKKLKQELHSDKSVTEILSLWKSIYEREAQNVDWELLDFIGSLKKDYPVYLFTDTIDTHDEYNSTRGIYNKFTKVFKSNEEGLSKLNDDAFLNVLTEIDAKPDECVFIDDLEVNVSRANNLGIHGLVYNNEEGLKEELFQLGIKIG